MALLRAQGATDSLEVFFEPPGGFYNSEQAIELYAPGATAIYYTLDGSAPTRQSQAYAGEIRLSETAVVRAIAFANDQPGSRYGQSYFFREESTAFPIVSIGISPGILFHPSRGIFVQGSNAVDSLWYKPGANFWSRREYPAHIDLFTAEGELVHNHLTGLRLFGGMSRLFPQKSLALVTRKRYGKSRFKHPIFGKKAPKSFKFLVLRNSGSDFGKSHFRDAFMTELVRDWDLETQAYQPAHVYINGNYWGIYNLREKVNRYFVASHADEVDRDSIDLLEHYAVRKRGSRRHYQSLLDFLERYDLDVQGNYEYLESLMEVDNFMYHQIAQIYFNNQDAGGNIKYWRPNNTPEGRWRWILYDTDWGYGSHSEQAYRHNSLAFHTDPAGPHWPNPPWSTLLLRKLLQNEGFRHRFVNAFMDKLNTSFSSEQATGLLTEFYAQYRPEIGRHLQRWRLSESYWEEQVDIMRDFAAKRPEYLRSYLDDYFDGGGARAVLVEASPGGKVLVNQQEEVERLDGYYFANYPIQLRAIPRYGYRFAGWAHDELADREITADLKAKRRYVFRARFEPFTHPLMDQVMINEVCPKSKRTDDWIEIYNNSDETVDLTNWTLTDARNEFRFPTVALLPNDYLILCRNAEKFRAVHPDAYNVVGGMGFGLNKRQENLGLYDGLGATVDSFAYEVPLQDTAFTLSLLLPTVDNAEAENWELRPGRGTPNAANPYYVESRVRIEQAQWLRLGLAAGVLILGLLALYWRRQQLA
ncbi:MAG: CotH kinase family protein [Bacteroidota bacterium]